MHFKNGREFLYSISFSLVDLKLIQIIKSNCKIIDNIKPFYFMVKMQHGLADVLHKETV